MINQIDKDRFLAKVQKTDGCWLWCGAIKSNGYGNFWIGPRSNRRSISAHRFAHSVFNGPIPDRLFVCHSCDNRRCVNPSHLWLGTCKDNLRDMHRKGRFPRHNQVRGERVNASRLSANEVIEIRRRFARGATKNALARDFGVTPRSIRLIVTGQTWAHLPLENAASVAVYRKQEAAA